MKQLFRISGAVALSTALLASCNYSDGVVYVGGPADSLAIAALQINAGLSGLQGLNLEVGDTLTLGATAFDGLGFETSSSSVLWSSTAPGVASINSTTGRVTAQSPGAAIIVATSSGLSANINAAVEPEGGGTTPPPAPQIGTIAVDPGFFVLTEIGAQAQIVATAYAPASEGGGELSVPITWQSSDEAIARISQAGVVTAVGLGTVFITAANACCNVGTGQIRVEQEGAATTDLHFMADWGTAQGGGSNALRDNGLWNHNLCEDISSGVGTPFHTLGAVVDGGAAGFPPPIGNIIRFEYWNLGEGETPCYMVAAEDRWGAPDVGQYIYERFYVRTRLDPEARLSGGGAHFWHHGPDLNNAYGSWFNLVGSRQEGGYMHLQFLVDVNMPQGSVWRWDRYEVDTTYRIEVRRRREGPSTASVEIRIYDAAGNLVADGDDWSFSHGNGEWGTSMAQARPMVHFNDDRYFRRLEVGNNGPAGQTSTRGAYMYIGAVAVRVSSNSNDWIGPYPVTGVEN